MSKTFPPNPKHRLQNTVVPDFLSSGITNPILERMKQIPGFGNEQCTPQIAAVKLRESFDAIPAPALIEHCAHAKRWVREHITAYVDGYLPTVIRKLKYAADVMKILKYIARVVATLRFLESLLRKEIVLANAWANEVRAIIVFAEKTLTPTGLRTQAENELAAALVRVKGHIAQQVSENTTSITCLI